MQARFIGGPLDSHVLEIPNPAAFFDAAGLGNTRVRYAKKTWWMEPVPIPGDVARQAFFVLDSLSEAEATQAIMKHIRGRL
jgi:hypothetical protein